MKRTKSKTDPESRLARKGDGNEARLGLSTQALMENRNVLRIEREQALLMLVENSHPPVSSPLDKVCDARDFLEQC